MRTPALRWIVELLRLKPAPIPWAVAVRMGFAIVTPVAVGIAMDELGVGVLVSIGAMSASLSDQGGRYRSRARRMSTVAAAGAAGFAIGGLVLGHGPLVIVLVVLVSGLVCGLVSMLSNVASVASLQFLIYLIVASKVGFISGAWWLPPLLYLLGGAWALLLSLVGGIGRVTAPERTAVAAVFRALATLMEASGRTKIELARQELTAVMNTAYDTVVTSRANAGGRDRRVRRLAALLNAATPVIETTLTLIRNGSPIPPGLSASTRLAADNVLKGSSAHPPAEQRFEGAPVTGAIREMVGSAAALAALERRLGAIFRILSGATPGDVVAQSRPGFRDWLVSLRDAVTGGATTWLPVVRLVLCLGVAEAVTLTLPLERTYWVALTVAVTLKPDFGSVFARAVQRGLGTILGVLIGTVVLVFVPYGVPILLVMMLFAVLLPITIRRNYGLFATFLTPLIVLQLDLVNRNDHMLVFSRLTDTAIGCAIVLLVGYLPWPGVWRSRTVIGDHIAAALNDVTDYLRVAFHPVGSASPNARRRAYRSLSDTRTALQQSLAEPPPISTRASAWWPAIVALERVTDAITAVATSVALGGAAPADEAVRPVVAAMDELSAALRKGRSPAELSLPNMDQLAGIVDELQAAQAVFAGPGLELDRDR
jgi:uncharacterized membrane protein YccC